MRHKADIILDQQGYSIPSELELENRVLRARLETLSFLAPIETEFQPSEPAHSENHHAGQAPDFEFNSSRDTIFSHGNAAFDKVLHIFNGEYYGIRSAAGNLPGGKLAVSAYKKFLPRTLSKIAEQISAFGYNKFVLHGYSKSMDDVARYIHRVFGRPVYSVWHGNFAQLVYQGEREAFEHWRCLLDEGVVTKAHILKQNASDFLERGFAPLLLNLPPKWTGSRIAPAFSNHKAVTAFLPSWIDVRKNWHANMLAAERSDIVHRLFYYADANLVFDRTGKSKRIKFDPITHMDVMSSVDVVLNATLIDCHPMVDLEGLACYTPAITSKLFLGHLDLHPYAQLTNIDNVLDTKEISERISIVSRVQSDELMEMMSDYSASLISTSFSRYGEFLDL